MATDDVGLSNRLLPFRLRMLQVHRMQILFSTGQRSLRRRHVCAERLRPIYPVLSNPLIPNQEEGYPQLLNNVPMEPSCHRVHPKQRLSHRALIRQIPTIGSDGNARCPIRPPCRQLCCVVDQRIRAVPKPWRPMGL